MQNGVAERFVGNCRRNLLNHVIMVVPRQNFISAQIETFDTRLIVFKVGLSPFWGGPDQSRACAVCEIQE
jgi:hypothetical protein